MRNILKPLVLLLVAAGIQSCQGEDPFLITETRVGPLLQTSKVSELETLFAQDSLVRDSLALKLGTLGAKIEVYENGGRHLLSLSPGRDSVPGIENIQIQDPRYRTKQGIGLKSTFGDIERNYEIKKIVTTLKNVVVFPKGSNLYFTIDKGELPANIRFSNAPIEGVQIPSEAKIKFMMLGWESELGDQSKP